MRKSLFFLIIIIISAPLFAGDIATFVNLGFSLDSNYYMFGQYGISAETYNSYAEIYFVDVHKNKFVSGGVNKSEFDGPVQLGQTGFGAFMNLYSEVGDKSKNLKIDHLLSGRLIYLLINGEEPKEELSFRDFEGGNKYRVLLIQKSYEEDEKISSTFHLNVFVTDKSGETKSHIVGLPDYKREDVRQYRIKQIMFSPDEASLVVVIEKEFSTKTGISIRYMVETFTL